MVQPLSVPRALIQPDEYRALNRHKSFVGIFDGRLDKKLLHCLFNKQNGRRAEEQPAFEHLHVPTS